MCDLRILLVRVVLWTAVTAAICAATIRGEEHPTSAIISEARARVAKINQLIDQSNITPEIDVDKGDRYPEFLPREYSSRELEYKSYIGRNRDTIRVDIALIGESISDRTFIGSAYWVWEKDSLKSLIWVNSKDVVDKVILNSPLSVTNKSSDKCLQVYTVRKQEFDESGHLLRITDSETTVDHHARNATEQLVTRLASGKVVKTETREWNYWEYPCDKPCCDPPRPGEHAE